jgi:hypothetical protein
MSEQSRLAELSFMSVFTKRERLLSRARIVPFGSNKDAKMITAWLSWVSRGLVVVGALFGLGAVIYPLLVPGAMSLGVALWAAAATLKVVREYLLGTPLPSIRQGYVSDTNHSC